MVKFQGSLPKETNRINGGLAIEKDSLFQVTLVI
jgi:hypothetical protein